MSQKVTYKKINQHGSPQPNVKMFAFLFFFATFLFTSSVYIMNHALMSISQWLLCLVCVMHAALSTDQSHSCQVPGLPVSEEVCILWVQAHLGTTCTKNTYNKVLYSTQTNTHLNHLIDCVDRSRILYVQKLIYTHHFLIQ